jgi:heme/copper-type cytochrome/quinol oxidase subunit 4
VISGLKTSGSVVRKVFGALARRVPERARGYVKENWGAPFVVGFMALLMTAAVFLLMNFAVLANEISVYAYYALVVGVVLQLVCFLKYRGGEGEAS